MTREDLLIKVNNYLDSEFAESKECCESHLLEWVDAVMTFRSKTVDDCCLKTLRELQHSVLEESSSSDYIVRKDAMFGDLNEIRRLGFENRYVFNIQKTKTYKDAYQRTENEYIDTFGRRRYASYDSFRNVRNRHIKKK